MYSIYIIYGTLMLPELVCYVVIVFVGLFTNDEKCSGECHGHNNCLAIVPLQHLAVGHTAVQAVKILSHKTTGDMMICKSFNPFSKIYYLLIAHNTFWSVVWSFLF